MVDTMHIPTVRIRSMVGHDKFIVTYYQAGCSSRREYVDIYKAYSLFDEWPSSVPENKNMNGIIGPTCLSLNTLYRTSSTRYSA